MNIYKKHFKRFIDIILSILVFIILLPVFLIVSLLIMLKLGKPIFYKVKRPGLHGKLFTIYKFRSMSDERDENGELLLDSIRLTKFGRILRSTSIDELPSLVNVIKGDMSLVGPRPLSKYYLPLYTLKENRRHNIRPGITGLAQVNGRNSLKWEDRFSYDIYYVDNVSFLLDLKIIYKTIFKVFRKEDIGERDDTLQDFDVYRKQQKLKDQV